MSFAFIEYADGSIDYQEDVSASWGDDGSLLLSTSDSNYTWLNLGFAKSVRITDDPIEFVEIDYDETDDESSLEDGSEGVH